MKKQMFRAFSKKLFGAGYENLIRALLVCLAVFGGLRAADLKIPVSAFICDLMVSTFTAGVMWQALSSKDQALEWRDLYMLPFQEKELVFMYIAVLGIYTLGTKTALLLAVLLAVSDWNLPELAGCLLCSVHAVLLAAEWFVLYRRKRFLAGGVWVLAALAALYAWRDQPWFPMLIAADGVLLVLALKRADGLVCYVREKAGRRRVRSGVHGLVWRYFLRYLNAHRNYLANTAILWCAACVLPHFFRGIEGRSAIPVGFALLSLNTPLGILLSCDPALERAVRFLPGQRRRFMLPYGLFLFSCNLMANCIFMISWKLQIGSFSGWMPLTAVCFAAQSAVCSVLLEWYAPIRGWKIESDLWHHPRKYVVPAVMLVTAGGIIAVLG